MIRLTDSGGYTLYVKPKMIDFIFFNGANYELHIDGRSVTVQESINDIERLLNMASLDRVIDLIL